MILILDDDIAVCTSLSLLLEEAGYACKTLQDPAEALKFIRITPPKLVLMDMNYSIDTSGKEGLELLQKFKILQPLIPIILITGWGSITLAVEGMKMGASDFVTKPWNNKHLLNTIKTALHLQSHPIYTHANRAELEQHFSFGKIIGQSAPLLQLLQQVGRIAPTTAPVLISGENGTGKELIADAIHANSTRSQGPFIKVNLGGLPPTLFESEIFGHIKGAFTDAQTDRQGRFALADGGTLFLDEIGELSLTAQVKLLRVLQEQTFEPVGSSKSQKVDVRIICATNKNLPKLISEGTFREDLYYRINLIHLEVPALRQRTADIATLANYFVAQACQSNRITLKKLTKEAHEVLKHHPFPGNIRELRNLMERATLMTNEDAITQETLEQFISSPPNLQGKNSNQGLKTLDTIEKEAIEETLNFYHGNVSQTARSLGISRGALYRRLQKYQIPYDE
ncbi:MAG: sigma-54 dependent transcriptional regulator [Bacteroidales bacterium]